MIYLFCNEKYGSAFIRVVQDYKKSHRNFRVTLIFSSKKNALESGFKAKLRSGFNRFRNRFLQVKKASFYHLPVLIIKNVNEPNFYDRICFEDVGIIAGFNQIFKDTTIRKFKDIFNFHPSLLPFYRGPVPSYWCIKNNEAFSGYTLHRITATIDSGDILYQDIIGIGDMKDPDKLDRKIAQKGALKLAELINHIVYGNAFNIEQIDAKKIYTQHVDYLSFPENKE